MEALLEAGAELFATRGPAGVSVRDIAAHAGVNHGLVHRHFGSKRALLGAVLSALSQQIAEHSRTTPTTPDGLPTALGATMARGHYWRVLARAMLDGEDPNALQASFPVVEGMVAHLSAAQRNGAFPADIDPRVVTAMSVALGLGWLVFEPFLRAAAGLEEQTPAAVRQQALTLWQQLLNTGRVTTPSASTQH